MTRRRDQRNHAVLAICLGLAGCYGSSAGNASPDSDRAGGDELNGNGNRPGVPGVQGPGGLGAVGAVPLDCAGADAGLDGPPLLETHTVQLWPPNHKLHEITVDDCVTLVDPCDRDLHAEFIWASSDEPINDIGDGNHAPDIVLSDDCQVLAVRSERQGPKDGRVYTLGVRVVDHEGGVSEASCRVVVAHDQSGVAAADSGESYRIRFDGSAGRQSCDGEPPPPTTPPTTPPPGTPNDPPSVPEGMDPA